MWEIILVLSIIQGITEFLPISSTGHLVVVSEFLSSGEGNQEALNAYLIVIQAGAIMAVALLLSNYLFAAF